MDDNTNPEPNPYGNYFAAAQQQLPLQQAQGSDGSQPQFEPNVQGPVAGDSGQVQPDPTTMANNTEGQAPAMAAQDPNMSAMQGYPLLMQQYLMQQAQQQQMLAAGAAGGFLMPQAMQPLPAFMNWGALAGDPNLAAAAFSMNGMGLDPYADQGYLGPWSANSAGLLGRMGAGIMPMESIKSTKRMRKKPKDRPKRPLSAYNIFFREERQRILEKIPEKVNDEDRETDGTAPDENTAQSDKQANSEGQAGPDGAKAIAKGCGTANLKEDSEASRSNKKQRPHGKIGFESLAKVIGTRWQELSPEQVSYYKAKAEEDTARYKGEMEVYLGRRAGTHANAPYAATSVPSQPQVSAVGSHDNGDAPEGAEEPPSKKIKTDVAEATSAKTE